MSDHVNHPSHYNVHPSGVEAIDVCRYMPFNLGNAFKYVNRAGHKGNRLQDLEKAKWYLRDEFAFDGAGWKCLPKLVKLLRYFRPKPPKVALDAMAKVIASEPHHITRAFYEALRQFWINGHDDDLWTSRFLLVQLIAEVEKP